MQAQPDRHPRRMTFWVQLGPLFRCAPICVLLAFVELCVSVWRRVPMLVPPFVCFEMIDGIEASGNDPCADAINRGHTLANRLAARSPRLGYTAPRHAAHHRYGAPQ